jgi:hypothetical protein
LGERTSAVRAVLRQLSALCLVLLVLSGTLTAGGTYLWCSMMQASVETCCCAPERSALQVQTDERPEIHSGCCQSHGHEALDQGRLVSSAIEVPPALPAAALRPAPVLAGAIPVASYVAASPSCAVRASPIRAGPRTASEHCAKLQVFRC